MNSNQSSRKRKGSARARHAARQRRRSATTEKSSQSKASSVWWERIKLLWRDIWWNVTHRPQLIKMLGFVCVIVLGLFVASHVFAGRIFPGVWSMGVYLGDMTVEEAESALLVAWFDEVRIELITGGQSMFSVSPAELGLQLNALQTAEAARSVGMSGIPLGYGVLPVVEIDYRTAQSYLIDLTDNVYIAPYEAGYEWSGEQLVTVDGRAGRMLDVASTMEHLLQAMEDIASSRRLDLSVSPLSPTVLDASPYLEEANVLASQDFHFTGYDPFTNEQVPWTATREEFTRWLAVGNSGLTLRDDEFRSFVDTLGASLNEEQDGRRYLDPHDAMTAVQAAISDGQNSAVLRIRYIPGTYEVAAGDTGFRIGRKNGLPFLLIREANPGVDWDNLSIGQILSLPSSDITLPVDVVAHKRIIVNLETQTMTAYENGQEVFHWSISSGIDSAPTSPGIFQILNHQELARGSSYTLCDDVGCGQWEMFWFMGVYEIQPGLMNGFHGAVVLPNGAYLGGGNVGSPYTFGCIMSRDDQGRLLYDWADDGTIVEIISYEFVPRSDLGRLSLERAA